MASGPRTTVARRLFAIAAPVNDPIKPPPTIATITKAILLINQLLKELNWNA